MAIVLPFLSVLLAGAIAAYHRWRLASWVALSAALLVACALLGASGAATFTAAVLLALVAVPLLVPAIRKPLVTAPLLKFYTRILPPLSDTERTALEAGTVGFEGELFSGMPKWEQLLAQPKPVLTAEEQAFLDGPVEEVCRNGVMSNGRVPRASSTAATMVAAKLAPARPQATSRVAAMAVKTARPSRW